MILNARPCFRKSWDTVKAFQGRRIHTQSYYRLLINLLNVSNNFPSLLKSIKIICLCAVFN